MRPVVSSSLPPSSVDSTYAFMKPGKVIVVPVEVKPHSGWSSPPPASR